MSLRRRDTPRFAEFLRCCERTGKNQLSYAQEKLPVPAHRFTSGTTSRAIFSLTVCMTAACLFPVSAAAQTLEHEWSVEAELEKARKVGGKSDNLESSLLGPLPTAAEYAAAQPNLRAMYTSLEPLQPEYGEEQQHDVMRDYRFLTFIRLPRVSEMYPLGPTGAYIRDMNGRGELIVVQVLEGTPADGLLRVDDILLGANGRMFRPQRDPRPPLGYALYESQTEKLDGVLTLHLARQGKPLNVQIELKVRPAYGPTWPYDCPRSEEIIDEATDYIIERSRNKGLGWWGAALSVVDRRPTGLGSRPSRAGARFPTGPDATLRPADRSRPLLGLVLLVGDRVRVLPPDGRFRRVADDRIQSKDSRMGPVPRRRLGA